MYRLPPDPRRRQLFEHYTLPAPDYRQYLIHYVASCYRRPVDYLCGRTHAFSDPAGALCEHSRSRNFEVRIPDRLAADATSLQAVFVRQTRPPVPAALADWLHRLQVAGVEVKRSTGSKEHLAATVRTWILQQLGYRP